MRVDILLLAADVEATACHLLHLPGCALETLQPGLIFRPARHIPPWFGRPVVLHTASVTQPTPRRHQDSDDCTRHPSRKGYTSVVIHGGRCHWSGDLTGRIGGSGRLRHSSRPALGALAGVSGRLLRPGLGWSSIDQAQRACLQELQKSLVGLKSNGLHTQTGGFRRRFDGRLRHFDSQPAVPARRRSMDQRNGTPARDAARSNRPCDFSAFTARCLLGSFRAGLTAQSLNAAGFACMSGPGRAGRRHGADSRGDG